jgi:hypothetical protein
MLSERRGRRADAYERVDRIPVDAFRRDDHQAPAVRVEPLAPAQVVPPLPRVVRVLPTVVLHRHA